MKKIFPYYRKIFVMKLGKAEVDIAVCVRFVLSQRLIFVSENIFRSIVTKLFTSKYGK
jgi:hypothetical protein